MTGNQFSAKQRDAADFEFSPPKEVVMKVLYRFTFDPDVDFTNVEDSLSRARAATESIHGSSRGALDRCCYPERQNHAVIINGSYSIGGTLACNLFELIRKTVPKDRFRLERVPYGKDARRAVEKEVKMETPGKGPRPSQRRMNRTGWSNFGVEHCIEQGGSR